MGSEESELARFAKYPLPIAYTVQVSVTIQIHHTCTPSCPSDNKGRIALQSTDSPNSYSIARHPILGVPPAARPHDGNHGSGNGLLDGIPQECRVLGPGVVDEG